MKTPFKSVLATFVALSLSIFLSGCFEEDAKTASQGDAVSSLVSDSGKVRLVLKPGTSSIEMSFSNKADADRQGVAIRKELVAAGIEVKRVLVSSLSISGGGDQFLFISVGPIRSSVELHLEKAGMTKFLVKSSFGEEMALWDESYGSTIRYVG